MPRELFRSDEEVENLLSHTNNGVRTNNVSIKTLGSGNHGNHGIKRGREVLKTTEDKADVAVLANLIGNKETAELLDVDKSVVSSYKNGKSTGGNGKVETDLVRETEERLDGIKSKVIDRVELFLEVLAGEKITEMKGKDLANSADKLVNTYDKLNRRHDRGNGEDPARPRVHYYAPVQMNINQYMTKEV